MDKKIALPSSVEAHISVCDLSPERAQVVFDEVQEFLSQYGEHASARMIFSVKRANEAAGEEPCHANPLNLTPLSTGSEWLCVRVKGHDDHTGEGGHVCTWVDR